MTSQGELKLRKLLGVKECPLKLCDGWGVRDGQYEGEECPHLLLEEKIYRD